MAHDWKGGARGIWERLRARIVPSYRSWPWAFWVGGIAMAAAVVLVFRASAPAGMPARALQFHLFKAPTKRPIVVAFYEPLADTSASTSSYASLTSHYENIDVLAPYWYRLGWGGVVEQSSANQKVIAFAHSHKIKVWPLVGNNGYEMLTTLTGRKMAARNLTKLADAHKWDGVFLDWELVPANQRSHFNAFVVDVARSFHKKGRAVAVAVFPKIGVTPSVQGVYDYSVLGKYADAVALMTYDHHQNSSPPGAVAPLNWVSANVHYALQFIPREKLLVGVATYGYNWAPSGVSTVTAKGVEALVSRLGIKPTWSATGQEPHFTYTDASGQKHTVWYESAKAVSEKFALVKRLNVAGIAIWRIGGETPTFWKALTSSSATA